MPIMMMKKIAPVAGALVLTVSLMSGRAEAAGSFGARMQAPEAGISHVDVDHRRGGGWNGGGSGYYRELGPRQIRRSLRHRGFHRIKILDRRGPMYIVKAHGGRGVPVRLVVDLRNAAIVRSRPLGSHFYWGRSW